MFTTLKVQPKRYFLHGVPYLQLCRATRFATPFVLSICFPMKVRPYLLRQFPTHPQATFPFWLNEEGYGAGVPSTFKSVWPQTGCRSHRGCTAASSSDMVHPFGGNGTPGNASQCHTQAIGGADCCYWRTEPQGCCLKDDCPTSAPSGELPKVRRSILPSFCSRIAT